MDNNYLKIKTNKIITRLKKQEFHKVLKKLSKFKKIHHLKEISNFKTMSKIYPTKKYNSHFSITFIYIVPKNVVTASIIVG
jgi:hypothetical protein